MNVFRQVFQRNGITRVYAFARLLPPGNYSRRRFLRQSFAFSALGSLGSLSALAEFVPSDRAAAEMLVLGDWGYEDQTAQTQVAAGLSAYAKQHSVRPQALLMLRSMPSLRRQRVRSPS